jgi:CBS domain-containing protein
MDEWAHEDALATDVDETASRPHVLTERMLRDPIRLLEPRPPVTVAPTATVGEVVGILREHRIGCVLVVDGTRLAGIVTERDLLLKLDLPADPAAPAAPVMTADPEVLSPDDPIAWALNKMSVGGFRHVPLVDAGGRPVGVVSVKDIVDYLVDCFPNEVLTVPPDPARADAWRARDGA